MYPGKYIGIDFNEKYAMVSYYAPGMSEPCTVSLVTGSECYQISMCVSKKKGIGQWFFGEEAKKNALEGETVCAESLLRRAIAGEQIEIEGQAYEMVDLFFLFFKKILALPQKAGANFIPDKLVIAVEKLNQDMIAMFSSFIEKLEFPVECLIMIDYRESFYYYALSQAKELCLHDVALYYGSQGKFWFWLLSYDKGTQPKVVTMEEKVFEPALLEKDESFLRVVRETLPGHIISAVYLIGDGFDGNWMHKSLAEICRGRRAFLGKNLFSKGACYAGAAKSEKDMWPFVYMGDNEFKINLSLKVENRGNTEFFTLLSAGENWYESKGECEVILQGEHCVDFWLTHPKSRQASVQRLELTDLPKRPERTTRLRITAKPVSAEHVNVTIRDMGFGEIFKSSEKVWEHTMLLA